MLQKVYNSQQRIITFISQGNNSLLFLIALSGFFCFWNLGSEPLHEWDESRNGVNAVEMIQNGDYVNLYYGGEPDTWNAKPPLMIWLIAFSFKLFGFSEFALRFPAALAAFFSFIVLYQLVRLYSSKAIAFFSCFVLLTVDGIVGVHVGRTGDFDALLLLFLLLSIYHFVRFIDFDNKHGLFLSALFLGLAFYTKGLASLFILPGLFLYTVISKKLLFIFKSPRFYLSALIFVSFIVSWSIIVHFYGIKFDSSCYSADNSFETMWKYDVVARLTSGFNNKLSEQDHAFFFTYLDVKFNIWNYVLYLTLILLVYGLKGQWYKLRNWYKPTILPIKLMVLSCCIFLSMGLILSLAAEAHFWYMAPAIPFIAFFTIYCIKLVSEKVKIYPLIASVILLLTFSVKIVELNSHRKYPVILAENQNLIRNAKRIKTYNMNRQDYLLYLKLNNRNVIVKNGINQFSAEAGDVIFISNELYDKSHLFKNKTRLVYRGDNFSLLQ